MKIRTVALLLPLLLAAIFSFGASTAATAQSIIHLEAESGTLSGGASLQTAGGITYATGFSPGNGYISFSSISATPGQYELMIRYSAPSGSEAYTVNVNGAALSPTFSQSKNFYLTAAGAVTLAGSGNTIKIGAGNGAYSIDWIELRPIFTAQAEAGVLSGTASVQSNSGAAGGKYVEIDAATDSNNNPSGSTMSVNAPSGLYDLQIGYLSPYGQKQCGINIDNSLSTSVFVTQTTWATVDAGEVMLKGGGDTIFIGGGWGYYDIDDIILIPAAPDTPPLPVSTVPVDASATPQAKRLLAYLGSQYGGGRILSGQQSLSEFPYVENTVSQQPAVLGIDLIDYSPSRTLYGTMPGASGNGQIVEPAIQQQAANNNIVDVMWHWNAPDDLINSSTEHWYSGFYTDATSYNLSTALANPDSNDYKLLIADMDTVAQQLQKLQNAGIPVLWRPLHEASGEFFWWGAQGPDSFIQLWQLMYNRFTGPLWNLHNLIWVFGGSDPSWYPGDKYVDLVGADIYDSTVGDLESDPTYTTWEQYKQAFDGDKMIAMTEVGGVPDSAMLQEYGVNWLFFLTWNGFGEQVPANQFQTLYNEPTVTNASNLSAWNWTPASTPLTSASVTGAQNSNSNGWFNGQASVTLSATDTNAITATYYTIDGGSQHNYTGPFTVSGDGIHPVAFWSVDKAGNTETTKTRTVLIDSGLPTSLCTGVSSNSSGYQVSFNASDALSGAQVVEYQIDGGSTNTTTSFSAPVSVDGTGNHTLSYWSIDVAGNAEAAHSLMLSASSVGVSSLTINPASITSGQSATGTVTLTGAAPSGGASVLLASSNTSAANVPATVTAAAGATTATFSITAASVSSTSTATVTATYNGISGTASLNVTPPAAPSLKSVILSPSSIQGGSAATTANRVSLTGNATANMVVALTSSNTAAATVPSSVTIQSGYSSHTFTLTTKTVASAQTVTITARYGGVTRTAALTVTPPPDMLKSLALSPTSTQGGTSTMANRVSLVGNATAATTIALTSSNTSVATVPSTVTVQSGYSSHLFTIVTKSVSSATAVTITAKCNGVTQSAMLTVTPAGSSSQASAARFDFNKDGHPDLIWYNTGSGDVSVWDMNDQSVLQYGAAFTNLPPSGGWQPAAAPDVNGDGYPDLLWWNNKTGELSVWTLQNTKVVTYGGDFGTIADTHWKPVAVADSSSSSWSLVFQNTATGDISRWLMSGTSVAQYGNSFYTLGAGSPWQIVGAPDLDGDGKSDLLFWNSSTGEVSYWSCDLANSNVLAFHGDFAQNNDTAWHLVGSEDFNGDGHPDLFWWNSGSGAVSRWLMNGASVTSYGGTFYSVAPSSGWVPQGAR